MNNFGPKNFNAITNLRDRRYQSSRSSPQMILKSMELIMNRFFLKIISKPCRGKYTLTITLISKAKTQIKKEIRCNIKYI